MSTNKRRVERTRSRIIDNAVSDSVESIVLHTAEDSKTLIRTWADLLVSPIDTAMATSVYLEVCLAIAPASTSVVVADTAQSLDNDVPLQEIGR